MSIKVTTKENPRLLRESNRKATATTQVVENGVRRTVTGTAEADDDTTAKAGALQDLNRALDERRK